MEAHARVHARAQKKGQVNNLIPVFEAKGVIAINLRTVGLAITTRGRRPLFRTRLTATRG